jgi:hypothetical protein
MSSKLTLKLTNRCKSHVNTSGSCSDIFLLPIAPKRAIRKLPSSIELPGDVTVEDAKVAIAKASGVADFNRIGLFEPATKSNIKDRKALLKDQAAVVDAGEVLVKDLGKFC